MTILTPFTDASCGYRFEVGSKYIVYVTIYDKILYDLKRRNFDNKTFWTHHCSRTTDWNKKEEGAIMKYLKK